MSQLDPHTETEMIQESNRLDNSENNKKYIRTCFPQYTDSEISGSRHEFTGTYHRMYGCDHPNGNEFYLDPYKIDTKSTYPISGYCYTS